MKIVRSQARFWWPLAASLLFACAADGGAGASSDANAASRVMSTHHEEEVGTAPGTPDNVTDGDREGEGNFRVLVTGFNDWKELGDPPNVWRCRDNPSCRLLLGEERLERPETVEGGELIPRLLALKTTPDGRDIEWSFATMPVTWQVSEEVSIVDHDLVIHLGLGVYDRFDQIKLERGAYNARRGKDAAGDTRDEKIQAELGEVKSAASESGIDAILDGLDGASFAGYEVAVARARPENSYLCNETHFRALVELDAAIDAGARLRRVHFVHIPYAENEDYARLAEGVGQLIGALISGRTKAVLG